MINYLLILVTILCGALVLSLNFNKKIGQAIFLYLLLVIFTLYILGIFIPLNIATYIIILATIVLFIISAIRKHKDIIPLLKSPTFYLFLLVFLFLIVINYNKGIYLIDEYTHWGDVVYSMFLNNTLSVNSINDSWYASYPPAISLFQYFLMKINIVFSENILYFGYQLFGFSLFLPFIDKIKFSNKFHFIIILAMVLFVPFILFDNYYNNIFVDALLGMVFGFTFIYPFIYKKMDKFDIITLSLALFVLTLLKDAGIFLSIISLINLFFILNKENKRKYFTTIGICIGAVMLAKLSWSFLILLNNTSISHESTFTFKSMIEILNGQSDGVTQNIINKFISTVSLVSVLSKPLNLTYFSLTMLFTLIIYLIYKKEKECYKSLFLLIVGAFIYMLGLLFVYLFNFPAGEAIHLTSYDRYSIIYLNGILFFIIVSLIIKYQNTQKNFLIFIIIMLFIPTGILYNFIYNNTNKFSNEFRENALAINNTEHVLIYSSSYNKEEYAKYHYLLKPIKLTQDCKQSCISKDKKVLKNKNYDYLYIDKIGTEIIIDDIKLNEKKWYKVVNGKLILYQKK